MDENKAAGGVSPLKVDRIMQELDPHRLVLMWLFDRSPRGTPNEEADRLLEIAREDRRI